MNATATTGQDRVGHYAHCDGCGWWVRCTDARAAVMQAWRHECGEGKKR